MNDFTFKPIKPDNVRYRAKRLLPNNDEELSLDEKCALKRLELKTLLDDISNYAVEKDVKKLFR